MPSSLPRTSPPRPAATHCSRPAPHRAASTCWSTMPVWSSAAGLPIRSEEHTSELQSLMRNSYAVFCLKKKKTTQQTKQHKIQQNHNIHRHNNTHINMTKH